MLNDMYRYTLYCFVLHKSTLSGCSQQKNININSSVCLIGRRGEHTFAIRLRRFQIVSLFACLCLVIRELRSTILSIYILCCVLRHFHTHTRTERYILVFVGESLPTDQYKNKWHTLLLLWNRFTFIAAVRLQMICSSNNQWPRRCETFFVTPIMEEQLKNIETKKLNTVASVSVF